MNSCTCCRCAICASYSYKRIEFCTFQLLETDSLKLPYSSLCLVFFCSRFVELIVIAFVHLDALGMQVKNVSWNGLKTNVQVSMVLNEFSYLDKHPKSCGRATQPIEWWANFVNNFLAK